MKIYANGDLIGEKSGSAAFFPNGASEFRIGGESPFTFTGSFDEFRLWNVARRPEDIRADMGRFLTGSETGLRLYFRFDEPSGAVATNLATASRIRLQRHSRRQHRPVVPRAP